MIFFLYIIALLCLGFWLRRQASDSVGFFLAGRQLGPWEVGFSLAATGFGGSAMLIASQMVYTMGLAGLWFSGSLALGFAVLGLAFARRIRGSGAHSLAHYFTMQFGIAAGWMVSVLIVVIEVAFFGLTVKSFAVLALPVFGGLTWLPIGPGGSEAGGMVLICGVFVAYTLMGGHKAVVATDVIQLGLIMVALVAVLLPVGLMRADWALLPASHTVWPFPEAGGPVFALNMLVLMGLSGIVGGDVFSKLLSARDVQAARNGALIASGAMALLAVTVAGLALCARVILPELEQPALAIPLLAREVLPEGVFIFISMAFLSVLLSTGDSVLITASTVLTLDVLRRSEQVPVALTRLLTLGLALSGLVLAIFFGPLLQIMKFGYTLLTASVVVPVIFTLALGPARRPARGVTLAALGSGLAVALLWSGLGVWLKFNTSIDPATVGAGASFLVMALGLLTNRSHLCYRK